MRDPLSKQERETLLRAPRPRRLQLAPLAEPARRRLPLADAARDSDRVTRPIYAVWELTLACDLSCRHCGSRAGRARSDELTTAECLDVVRQLAELGVREVAVIGGEAYLHTGWLEVIAAIKAHGMKPTMTSGGRGLNDELAQAAAKAGLFGGGISLDGLEATHDRLRGVNGSHAAALNALDALKRAGVSTAVNTQINRLTMPELPELLELIAQHGATAWQMALTVPMGRAADEPEVLLQPYDLLELQPMLASLMARASALGVRMLPANNIGYFGPHETTLRPEVRAGYSTSCGAGRALLGIEADGTIKGCPSLPTATWAGGNIRDHALVDIWERSSRLRYTRDRTVDDLWGYCRTCYYADNCRAGCTWTSETALGKPGNNPYCHHRALEHQRLGKRERLVQVELPPGTPFDHGRFELVVEDIDTNKERDARNG